MLPTRPKGLGTGGWLFLTRQDFPDVLLILCIIKHLYLCIHDPRFDSCWLSVHYFIRKTKAFYVIRIRYLPSPATYYFYNSIIFKRSMSIEKNNFPQTSRQFIPHLQDKLPFFFCCHNSGRCLCIAEQ